MIKLGENIKRLRSHRELTQEQLKETALLFIINK